MQIISEFLQRNAERSPTIHVIGDAMVDDFYQVQVTRISPESPNVCIMLSSTDVPSRSLPGGAANVCHQLKNFNTNANLFCLYDAAAWRVYTNCAVTCYGKEFEYVVPKVPRKKRFYHEDTQVGDRWDVEEPQYGLADTILAEHQRLLFEVWNSFKKPDVLVLSDYNKGLFVNSKVPYLNFGVKTIVDPKKGPLEKWRGCTIFKPNATEACEFKWGLDPLDFAMRVFSVAIRVSSSSNH